MGHLCPHGDAALAQEPHRARARHPRPDLPGLASRAIRRSRLGRGRQDPPHDVDGLPPLVSPCAGHPRREWCRAARSRTAGRRPGLRAALRPGRRGTCAGPPCGAGQRTRRPRRKVHPRQRPAPAAGALGPHLGRHRLRRTARQGRGRDRCRRVGHGQRRHGAGKRRGPGRPLHPPCRHPPHQQAHRREQSGSRPRLPGAGRGLETPGDALLARFGPAAAPRQRAAGLAPPERLFPPRQPPAHAGTGGRTGAHRHPQGRIPGRSADRRDGVLGRPGPAPRTGDDCPPHPPLDRPPRMRARRKPPCGSPGRTARPRAGFRIPEQRPVAPSRPRPCALLQLRRSAQPRQGFRRCAGRERGRQTPGPGHRRHAVPRRHRGQYARMEAYDKAELAGDEWTDADAPADAPAADNSNTATGARPA